MREKMNGWLDEVKRERASSTYKTYSARMNKLTESSKWDWNNLTTEKLQEVFEDLENIHKISTVHNMYDTALTFFKWLYHNQFIAVNPLEKVRIKPAEKHIPVIITTKQMILLLREAKYTTLYLPLLIATKTGMRRSEILALKWKDVNFNSQTISIVRNAIHTKRRKYTEGKSIRIIKPIEGLMDILEVRFEALLDKYSEEALVEMYICTNKAGEGIEPTYFNKVWRRFIKDKAVEHGISENLRFHDIRHSFITEQSHTMELKELSLLAGHSSVIYTVDYYVNHKTDNYNAA